MLQVICLDITSVQEEQYNKLFEQASQERKTKANRFLHREDAKRCILGEALLKRCYQELFSGEKFPEIIVSDSGKPYFKGVDKVHFNISHSGKWVVAAVSDQEVGIDVEKVCVQSDSVLKAVLTEKEYATIVNIPEQDDFFVRYWTIKESYVKLLGQGLRIHPGTLEIEKIQKKCKVSSIRLDEEYWLSVCGSCKVKKVEFVFF